MSTVRGYQHDHLPAADPYADRVFVIHGFGTEPTWTAPLARRLHAQGFDVINWSYPPWRGTVCEHAAELRRQIDRTGREDHDRRIHVVGHSMGAIVARCAALPVVPGNLGRIVMLAPPNQGTPVARFWAPLVGRRWPAVCDLSSSDGSFVRSLPDVSSLDCGVIAARLDEVVPLRCTHVPGEREHITLWHIHPTLVLSRRVAELVGRYLRTGSFRDPSNGKFKAVFSAPTSDATAPFFSGPGPSSRTRIIQ